jgi:CMP-N,N'-diacetyllegionaminic acid synthase
MKCVIFGKGLIGTMHAQILREQFDTEIRFFRHGSANFNHEEDISSWEGFEAFHPDFSVIANPTNKHIDIAIECAKRQVHLFLEKPLDCSMDRMEELKELVRQKELSSYVAYCLRFHPGIQKLKEIVQESPPIFAKVVVRNHLPSWNRNVDSKQTYSAFAKTGGGVLFDLSHELDYLHHIFGDIQFQQYQSNKLGNVTVNSPDLFNATFKGESTLGTVHLDYFTHKTERYVQLDYANHSWYLPLKEMKLERYEKRTLVSTIEFLESYPDMYINQFKYFIGNLGQTNMMNDIFEAEVVLRKLISLHDNE